MIASTRSPRLKITNQGRWNSALRRYTPGETATIRFVQRGIERTAELTFEADPTLEIVTFEAAGDDPSRDQLAFREAWLGE